MQPKILTRINAAWATVKTKHIIRFFVWKNAHRATLRFCLFNSSCCIHANQHLWLPLITSFIQYSKTSNRTLPIQNIPIFILKNVEKIISPKLMLKINPKAKINCLRANLSRHFFANCKFATLQSTSYRVSNWNLQITLCLWFLHSLRILEFGIVFRL